MNNNIVEFIRCVGIELRNERKEQDLIISTIANRVGVSISQISNLETSNPHTKPIYRYKEMSLALNIPLYIIIKRAENRYNNIIDNKSYNDGINELPTITDKDIEQFIYIIGDTLKEARTSLGISANKLAKQLKITRQAYSGYERMTRINISLYKVIELCGVLDVSIHYVIERAEKRFYENLRNGRDTTGDVHKES
ncbi:hypothetical protein AST04_08590 [Staphylococcus equorum]|nr:hypothetical protein AST04_08590 [Staphylococcus equorum]